MTSSDRAAAGDAVPDSAADQQFEDLDCSAMLADIWLALDGECDEHSLARLKRHLEGCNPCLSAYGVEAQVKQLIARKCGSDRAPEALRARLVVEIREWHLRADGR